MTHAYLKDLRTRLNNVAETMGNYSDSELRDIKNTADVFSMKIRLELVSRDARMVDEACALQEASLHPTCPTRIHLGLSKNKE